MRQNIEDVSYNEEKVLKFKGCTVLFNTVHLYGKGGSILMGKYTTFFRTFILIIIIEGIFNIFCLGQDTTVEMIITIGADILFAGCMGVVSMYLLKSTQRELPLDTARDIMRSFSYEMDEDTDSITMRLPMYRSFFMGEISYNKTTGILTVPYFMQRKI